MAESKRPDRHSLHVADRTRDYQDGTLAVGAVATTASIRHGAAPERSQFGGTLGRPPTPYQGTALQMSLSRHAATRPRVSNGEAQSSVLISSRHS